MQIANIHLKVRALRAKGDLAYDTTDLVADEQRTHGKKAMNIQVPLQFTEAEELAKISRGWLHDAMRSQGDPLLSYLRNIAKSSNSCGLQFATSQHCNSMSAIYFTTAAMRQELYRFPDVLAIDAVACTNKNRW
jgi:hypothetical protein